MRAVNRLAGLLLAVVLIAVGLFVIAETVLFLAGRPPWLLPLERWRDNLSSTELADRRVLTTAIVLLVAGLGVLILQVRRVTPTRLRSLDAVDARSNTIARWWLQRRSVERRAAAAAQSVWGVHDARAHAHGRPGRWTLSVSADAGHSEQERATDEVESAVRRELTRLSAPDDVPVSVSLRRSQRVA